MVAWLLATFTQWFRGYRYRLALGLIAIPIVFSLIRRSGLMVFALYRLLFGAMLIGLGLL